MSVIRVARRRRYTSVSKDTIDDERLSFRARGLLVYLLAKPDDWRTDSTSIARATTEGREAVRTAPRELRELGYLVQTTSRGDRGRWVTETTVYEVPQPASSSSDTDDGEGSTGAQELDSTQDSTGAQEPVPGESPTGAQESGARSTDVGELGALPLVELIPKTEKETPSAEGGGDKPRCELGRAVATAVWDARKAAQRPVPAQPFIAVAKIAERLLDAGHDHDVLVTAMTAAPTITTAAVEFQISRGSPAASNRTRPLASAAEHGPAGVVDPKDL